MKALFIGGTGTISTAIVKRLAEELNWEVWLLNRGNRTDVIPEGDTPTAAPYIAGGIAAAVAALLALYFAIFRKKKNGDE